MRKLLIAALLASTQAMAATIINPLPNNIQNGQPADATKLMGNFNQIVANVNGNAAALAATNVFTAPQTFSPALTTAQGLTAGQAQNDSVVWLGTVGGTANALTASSTVTPAAYAAGQRWKAIALSTNTGATTININGLGVRAVTRGGAATALLAGDIVAGQLIVLDDTGTTLQLLNPANVIGNVTGNVTAGTINASGLITTTYGQIAFPATQNPSANANTLDDYEEGSFTPIYSGSTTAGTGTYTIQQGRYTKVGNLVTFFILISWTSHTGSGNPFISGFPYPTSFTSNSLPVNVTPSGYSLGATVVMYGLLQHSGATNVSLFTGMGGSALSSAPFVTSGTLYISGSYPTN